MTLLVYKFEFCVHCNPSKRKKPAFIFYNILQFSMALLFPYTFSQNLQDSFRIEHAQKLETCRKRLREVGEVSSLESLVMIDAIQRLGIDHHFHNQIEQVLGKHNMILHSKDGYQGQDLHEVALRFRLLRQQGYHVPAGVCIWPV